ncbi:uncharacterized protein UDID_17080 [Ustilago sp. UG-2017a]|nr:uncharacterized protein UDID_17080 [Ustilago sp. UG-2017a]
MTALQDFAAVEISIEARIRNGTRHVDGSKPEDDKAWSFHTPLRLPPWLREDVFSEWMSMLGNTAYAVKSNCRSAAPSAAATPYASPLQHFQRQIKARPSVAHLHRQIFLL